MPRGIDHIIEIGQRDDGAVFSGNSNSSSSNSNRAVNHGMGFMVSPLPPQPNPSADRAEMCVKLSERTKKQVDTPLHPHPSRVLPPSHFPPQLHDVEREKVLAVFHAVEDRIQRFLL